MAKKLEVEDGYVTVRSTVLDQERFKVTPIKIRQFVSEVARVGVNRRFSKEITNGTWATVEVMIQAPCYPEELRDVKAQVVALSEEFMTEEIGEIEGMVKKSKSGSDDWDDDE